MSRCLLANKYPWTAAFSSCQFTPTALRGTRVRRARTRIYTPGQNVWQLRAPLCSTCSDRNYAKRRSPRERERGERMGSALETGEKKRKRKEKKRRRRNRGRNGERARLRADKFVQKKSSSTRQQPGSRNFVI